jgi:uncharacterized protein YcfJ
MNKSLLTGLIAGAVVATAGGAIAGYKMMNDGPDYARVTNVEPVMKTVRTPRQNCTDVPVTQTAPTRDPHRITGTAIGAVAGAVIGNQIGSGSGRDIARVGGAAAGGYAGNRIQKRMQENNTVTTTEQRCETVYDSHKERVGYDVTYELDGETQTVRMQHDPGERIPVKDGELVLSEAGEDSTLR